LRAGLEGSIAPQPVDRAVARDGDDPRDRFARQTVARPALDRCRECVLDSVLGQVPVAGRADERRDRLPEMLAEQLVDGARCDGFVQDAARSPSSAAALAA
jgi:hypothetical protein